MSYTDAFGGSTIQPSDVGYRAVALAANVTLFWPTNSSSATDFVARIMDVTPSAADLAITLPDARTVSAGQDILFRNLGAETFSVLDADGVVIATLTAGQIKYFYLSDNSTDAGVWRVVLFGVGTGALDAGQIAGAGLNAAAGLLQINWPLTTTGADFEIAGSDRAVGFVWTGGAGAITLPIASTIGNGFMFTIRNEGTGVLTVSASSGEFIDGAASIALQPQESGFVQTSGASNWYTIGRGRNQQFNFTLLVKNITGGTVTLTPTEASNVVQRYTGVLVSNAEIVLPSVVQVYYVSNQTSGAFTVTFRTAGVGSTVSVPAGQNAVLFCDGLNVINNSTTVSGLTSLLLSQGTVTTPSIAYNGDSSTGLYQPVSGSVAFTGTGTEVARFTGGASSVNRLQVTNSITGVGVTVGAAGTDANIDLLLTPKGTGAVRASGAFGLADGAAATPSLRFTSSQTTGLFRQAADVLGVTAAGLEVARFSSVALAVNGLIFANAATAGAPTITAQGADANVGISLVPKGTGGVLLPAGAVATPALAFSSDTNTGLFSGGADILNLVTGGIKRVDIDAGGIVETTVPGTAAAASVGLIVGSTASGTIGTETRVHIAATTGASRGTYIGAVNTNGAGNEHALTFGVGASTAVPVERMRLSAAGSLTVTGSGLFSGAVYGTIGVRDLGAYGGAGPNAGADSFVIEGSGDSGLSILTPNTGFGIIRFGDPESSTVGGLFYDHNTDRMTVAVGGSTVLLLASQSASYTSDSGSAVEIGFRGIPRQATVGTTLVATQRGFAIASSGTITVPNAVFSSGDAVSVYNNSAAAITIAQGASLTLRLAGTTSTGSRTLAARGFATIWFNASNEAVISGAGVS